MKASDFKIYYENIDVNDETLINMLEEAGELCLERKKFFEKAREEFDENNYYGFLVSKLYYEFAREEYDKLYFEAHKRRLING